MDESRVVTRMSKCRIRLMNVGQVRGMGRLTTSSFRFADFVSVAPAPAGVVAAVGVVFAGDDAAGPDGAKAALGALAAVGVRDAAGPGQHPSWTL